MKVVREVMNQMLEVWKQIPDVSDEFSPPPQSQASSKGITIYLVFTNFVFKIIKYQISIIETQFILGLLLILKKRK